MSYSRHRVFNGYGKGVGAVVLAAMVLCAGRAFAAAPPAGATAPGGATAGGAKLITGGIDQKTSSVRLLVNKSATITTARPYKRLSIAQNDIAEINGIGPTRILVTGKKGGSTQLTVWDEDDNSQTVDVLVQANLLQLRDLYSRLMPNARIDVDDNEGTIVLTGQAPTVTAADQAAQLASGYGSKVLNMIEVAGGQQVVLQVRFAEVSKTATSQLGVNFGYSDGNSFSAQTTGGVGPLGIRALSSNPDASDLSIASSSAANWFGRAVMGETALAYFVQALRSNNLLRVLAEPNLVTTSGQTADFLAGGEFPVPIVQGGAGDSSNTSITVEFKQFGVRLEFTPVVLGNGKLRLKLAPEVSDVDFTNAVVSGGFRIPGTRTRRMSTIVEMEDGQSFAVGGLLDNRVAANKDATPLLGDLPVIGALFRSVRYQRSETELVVLVTPHIVHALNPDGVPALPGEDWRHPSEGGLYLNGDLGGSRNEEAEKTKNHPRRFIGNYGLMPAPDSESK